VAQFVAAILAAAMAKAIVETPFEGNLGATVVSTDISLVGAFFLELIMTFFLVFVMFSTAIDPRGVGKLAPLAIGLVVLIDELIGVHWTGASMNPARTLGPQLVAGVWNNYWLYFWAPVCGAVMAAWAYKYYMRISPVNTDLSADKRRLREQRIAALLVRHLRHVELENGNPTLRGRLSDRIMRRKSQVQTHQS